MSRSFNRFIIFLLISCLTVNHVMAAVITVDGVPDVLGHCSLFLFSEQSIPGASPHFIDSYTPDTKIELYQKLETRVLDVLAEGPFTGKELIQRFSSTSADLLWQVVMGSSHMQAAFAGVHYPRIAVKKGNPPISNLSPS